jgi:hypothetical protein
MEPIVESQDSFAVFLYDWAQHDNLTALRQE